MKHFKSILISIFASIQGFSQCDFVDNITGLTMSSPPAGVAADPLQFTHEFVLVQEGLIYAKNNSADFFNIPPGQYYLYSLNYDINETVTLTPLLQPGQSWINVENYNGILDISEPYNNCAISICNDSIVLENSTLVKASNNFATGNYSQTYYFVVNDTLRAESNIASFNLSTIPKANVGSDCQLVAINYLTSNGSPFNIGDKWSSIASSNCNKTVFWDYLAKDIIISNTLFVNNLKLKGIINSNNNQLKWTIDDDKKIKEFDILKSYNGIDYKSIGKLKKEIGTSFDFFDFENLSEISYYKIKVLYEEENESLFSDVLILSRTNFVLSDAKLYPIPAQKNISVQFKSEINEDGEIRIVGIDGKEHFSKDFNFEKGKNLINVDISKLHKGSYFVIIEHPSNSTKEILKLII